MSETTDLPKNPAEAITVATTGNNWLALVSFALALPSCIAFADFISSVVFQDPIPGVDALTSSILNSDPIWYFFGTCILSLAALVTGIVALTTRGRYSGRGRRVGLAIWGVALGSICLIFNLPVFVALVVVVVAAI